MSAERGRGGGRAGQGQGRGSGGQRKVEGREERWGKWGVEGRGLRQNDGVEEEAGNRSGR